MRNAKRYLLFVLVALVLITAAGCKKKKQGEVVDFSQVLSQKEEINVWLDDEGGEYAAELIKEFNKTPEGRNITVRYRHEGSVESRDRLKVVGPTGGGPDVFQFPHDHLAPAIMEDLVYALPASTRELVEQRAHPLGAQIAQVQYNETTKEYGPGSGAEVMLYAMPTSIESVGLYYNKKLIDEAQVPETMEDLIAKAQVWNAELANDGSGLTNAEKGWRYLTTSSHFADSYFMQGFYSSFGYRPFGPNLDNKNQVGFESTEIKNALAWFKDSLKPVVSGDSTDTKGYGTEFEAGNIPLIIAGPWNIEAYKSKSDVIDLGVAQMPTVGDNDVQTYAGAIMTAVYKYSKNRSAAVKFVEFMNSDKAMELLYKHKGKLPALKTELLSNIPGVTADELLMAMSKQLETSIPMPTIPEVQHYWGPAQKLIEDIWKGVDIATATKEAQESYEALSRLGQ
jgi:arabinogalactan oligomer/maltooligosaccharide transport system substrate-binding protein